MERAWSFLERVCRYPHRGVGTPEEGAAAREAAAWLEAMGYAVEIQPFRAPRDTLYLGPAVLMTGFLGAAGLGFLGLPWLGLGLTLLLLVPLVGEMRGRGPDLDLYLPKVRSQNVIARAPERGDEQITLVISGHIDTQHATWLFHPRMVRHIPAYLNAAYGALALMPAALLLRALLPAAGWTGWLLAAGAALLGGHLIFLLGCAFTGGYINGANDNGTGAALVLGLAEHFAAHPVPGVRLHFLLPGAEEVGTRGMKQFLRRYSYDRRSTWFINLDNLGGGRLHYLRGEGMTIYHRYGPRLLRLAAAMAAEREGIVRVRENLLLPTDGMIPAALGYEAISFLAFLEDGSLPNYHWYTDTLERVDRDLLAYAEQFLIEYIQRLAIPLEQVAPGRQ
ncbi:MAG: M28 family metallopeptidase [Bacillota bacterium]